MRKTKNKLTFEEFSDKNRRRRKRFPSFKQEWTPLEWSGALAGECGEAANLAKKLRRGDVVDIKDIGKEIADVVCYADLLAASLGLSLQKCLVDKFNEVSDRVSSKIKL